MSSMMITRYLKILLISGQIACKRVIKVLRKFFWTIPSRKKPVRGYLTRKTFRTTERFRQTVYSWRTDQKVCFGPHSRIHYTTSYLDCWSLSLFYISLFKNYRMMIARGTIDTEI